MKQEAENADLLQKANDLAASFIARMGWDVPFYSDPRWLAIEAAAVAVSFLPPGADFEEAVAATSAQLPRSPGEFEQALAKAVALILWSDLQERQIAGPSFEDQQS